MTADPQNEEMPSVDAERSVPLATDLADKPQHAKIDRITALQETIDSLSLAMFEALRGLRDAVAPESGNLGGNTGNNDSNNADSSEPDFEEFWQSYRNGDAETVAMVKKVSQKPPHRRDDFIRIHAKVEMEKDAELVKELATTVLEKSDDIDERVSALPGMHRTRAEQMKYIEELLDKNCTAAEKLEDASNRAQERRDLVRKFVRGNTCQALGIVEESE